MVEGGLRLGPGLESELLIISLEGEVERHADRVVGRWPALPDYYGANLLALPAPPRAEDLPRWEACFAADHGPTVRHCTLAWEGEAPGPEAALEARGYGVHHCRLMRTDAPLRAVRTVPGLDVRPVRTDAEWAEALAVEALHDGEADAAMLGFQRRRMARYRALADAGFGAWMGAFRDGRLVGALGIFERDGRARYQSVTVHPDARRQGVGGLLVAEAGAWAREVLGARTLFIAVSPDSAAERVYAAVGFSPSGVFRSATRGPQA